MYVAQPENVVEYAVIDRKDVPLPGVLCVEIRSGEFAGVSFQFDDLRIGEEADEEGVDGGMPVTFTIVTLGVPAGTTFNDQSEKEVAVIGNILCDIIMKALEYAQSQETVNDNRTDDTETPDTQ